MSRILLDVDGVIMRNYALLDHVKNNAVRYVQKKIPGIKKGHSRINHMLYKKYGHTAIGLHAEFGVDSRDYDDFVYDRFLLDHLEDYILTDDNFKRDADTIRSFLESGKKVSFFSNAPMVWTEPIRESIDLRIGNGNYMKPNLESYLRFGKKDHFVFVDDNLVNLEPTLFLGNWTPVHFSMTQKSQIVDTINDIKSLNMFF